MVKHGVAPYIECSSKGVKELSAFYARIKSRGNRSIEEIYQSSKIFEGGVTGLNWRQAKGKKAVNQVDVSKLYSTLWDEYMIENPHLIELIRSASGLQDIFGQQGHCCQATELWRIKGNTDNPYNVLEIQRNLQPNPPGSYVDYDIETFPNIFTLGAVNFDTGARTLFEISHRKNQLVEMMDWFTELRMNSCSMVGFNSIGFDYPVLHFIIENKHIITVEAIYEKAMQIINTDWNNRFAHTIWEKDQHIPQIDLFKIHHFDNQAKMTSLKILEFNMMMETVEDLPFPPGTVLTFEEMDILISYMDHDIEATRLFHQYSLPNIEFRRKLSEKYGRNLMNHNDTKIGKDYFINELEKHQPGICYDKSSGRRKPRQTKRAVIHFKDVLFPYIQFEHPELQRVHNWFKTNSITNTKGELDLDCTINDFKFVFGTGGLHGSVEPCTFTSDDTYMILDVDVTSFYPSLGIVNRIFPAHLGEKFCDIYGTIKKERIGYAKKTIENEMLKLALNGSFGDTNSEYSPLYDPQYTMGITVNGQLLLCMLAEQLMKSPYVTMIQANTDGITFKCPRIHKPWVKEVMTWWEKLTGLDLEEAEYKRFFARDVNNYMSEFYNCKCGHFKYQHNTHDGSCSVNDCHCMKFQDPVSNKLKRIGAYAHETARENPSTREVQWHKNHSALVVQKAAEARLIHGTDIRSFIENHANIYDFLLRTKVDRTSKLVMVDYKGNDTFIQNTSRYYIAMLGHDLVKIMPPLKKYVDIYRDENGELFYATNKAQRTKAEGYIFDRKSILFTRNRRISINSGWKVSVCNNLAHIVPDDIEFEWFIQEAHKLVDPILNGGVR